MENKELVHQLILWVIILGIVIFQVSILKDTIKKVKLFLQVLSDSNRFRVHKVYVPIDEIDTINSQDIIDNLNHYKQNPILKKISETDTTYSIQNGRKDIITSDEEE
jgi:hypothetical protein